MARWEREDHGRPPLRLQSIVGCDSIFDLAVVPFFCPFFCRVPSTLIGAPASKPEATVSNIFLWSDT